MEIKLIGVIFGEASDWDGDLDTITFYDPKFGPEYKVPECDSAAFKWETGMLFFYLDGDEVGSTYILNMIPR